MEWIRGQTIGRGSFGKVDLAISMSKPSLMAVKSVPVYNSQSLKHERDVLGKLADSEYVIQCFGDSYGFENGERVFNVFLEYAENGSLYDRVKSSGEGLGVEEVRSLTRSVLRGLNDVHLKGFVHCDVKLQNILLCSDKKRKDFIIAKLADFGLAKRQNENRGEGVSESYLYGTPLYLAPETITKGEFDQPADIWALGCAVVEMLTGAPVWKNESNLASLLLKIAQKSPELPSNLSPDITDFLEKCFMRNPAERWTAKMLLEHSFITSKLSTISPRCPFDFPELVTPNPILEHGLDSWIEKDENCEIFKVEDSFECSTAVICRQLLSDQVPEWVFSDSWLVVR